MRKILNAPSTYLTEMLDGLLQAHPDGLAFAPINVLEAIVAMTEET